MGVSKKKQDAQSSSSSKRDGKKPMQHDDQEYVSRYQSFTPLNQYLCKIFMQVEPRGILTTPPKIKSPLNKRDMFKYCCYHSENGYDANDFRSLKDEIKRLIRCRQLREFDRKQNARQNQPQRQALVHQDRVVKEQEFELKTIIGGPSIGDTNRAQKSNAQ